EQYSENDHITQKDIIEFAQTYSSSNAIRWYTKDSFVYRLLNSALRTRNIDIIFKFRYFIVDVQKQLQEHYNDEISKTHPTVYRCQLMSPLELRKLQNSINKCISINTYLSTSTDKEVALMFGLGVKMGLLIEIDINTVENEYTRGVSIELLSYMRHESEVLFPIGSTFLVKSIEEKDNLWHLKLQLASLNDNDQLIDYIKINLNKVPSTMKFVTLLILMGEYEKAERYITMLIEELQSFSDNDETIGYAYDLMGQICQKRDDYTNALTYFERALNTIQPDNIYRAIIFQNIGKVYQFMVNNSTAREYYEKALKFQEKMTSFDLACLYCTFGTLYQEMEQFDDALIYFNKTLEICHLHSFNPIWYVDIFVSLATIYAERSHYNEALQFCNRIMDNLSKLVMKNHPLLITAYGATAKIYFQCGDYDLAMASCQKALNIAEKVMHKENIGKQLGIVSYLQILSGIGYFYARNGDTKNALEYAKKAMDVYSKFENRVPKEHPIITYLYNTLGSVYFFTGEFTLALEYLMKALDTKAKTSLKIAALTQIVNIYIVTNDIEKAMECLYKALQIISKESGFIANDNRQASIYMDISHLYKTLNNQEAAISAADKAIELLLQSSQTDYPKLASTYIFLAGLHRGGNIILYEKVLNIVNTNTFSDKEASDIHTSIGLYLQKQEDWPNTLVHYSKAFEYQWKIIPPNYIKILGVLELMSKVYQKLGLAFIEDALLWCQTCNEIYKKLLDIRQIPLKDQAKLLPMDGYISEFVEQSSFLTSKIVLQFIHTAVLYDTKNDRAQVCNYTQKAEEILNQYTGKKNILNLRQCYLLLGFAFSLTENFDQAIFYYEKSLEQLCDDYNDIGQTYTFLGHIYFKKQNYDMAISKLNTALRFLHNSILINHKQLSLLYSFTSACYFTIKDYMNAWIYTQQGINYELLSDSVNYEMCVTLLKGCAINFTLLKPWDYAQQLDHHLMTIDICQNHVDESQLQLTYIQTGFLYLKKDEYENALVYFNKALEHSTDPGQVYTWIARLYMINGKLIEAFKYTKKAIDNRFHVTIRDFQEISYLYTIIGDIYYRFGQYKTTLKYYKRAFYTLELYQSNRNNRYYMDIYEKIGRIFYEYDQLISARDYCSKARAISDIIGEDESKPVNLYITMGLIECKDEHYYAALDNFGHAFEILTNKTYSVHPEYKLLYNYIGYVYFKLGQTEIAMNNYQKTLSIHSNCSNHPNLAQVHKNIGLIYEKDKHDYSLALLSYRRALELLPSTKHPHYILYKIVLILIVHIAYANVVTFKNSKLNKVYSGLRVGEKMEVCGDATLHVSSINDSRCPANVMCFWAGQAMVQLLLFNKVASTTMDIIAGASAQATLGTNVYTVTLDDVMPYPGMNKNPSEAIVTVTCS
ncbi:unnamed protein product, partial [Adineta steineri]